MKQVGTPMKTGKRSPCPEEPDIRLVVQFATIRMEFVACLTAALVFVQDVARRRLCDVTVACGHYPDLPRLPNERLYLVP
ncbi:hypothetical protein [Nocardia bhagyanarayanae]|uniref:Uncharacterized protein n=1 Tax=Nocardia bhagyanarayanae TaxID=1215925 RepID=A0A543FFH5_9NOCA|nr:hypothetical protein [Nocardia bhagyanarayanae]TQM32619.1 hypothetical protein FB390_4312 [Nocardia bhagyanarayanae]